MVMHNQVVVVPNVVGKSVHDAMLVLSYKSLGLRLAHELIDDILPEGTIMQQIPAAERSIKPNQPVFVTVSKKTPLPLAPHVSDKTYTQLCKLLEKTSLTLKTIWLESSFPKNKCLGQYPLAGKEIIDNRLTVFASSGKSQLYVIPNFKGQPLEIVLELLKAHKVDCELVGIPTPLLKNEGYVVQAQQPMAGSIVDLNKALTMHLQIEHI
jgi:beta-lactam-binding protein with PASTA domain